MFSFLGSWPVTVAIRVALVFAAGSASAIAASIASCTTTFTLCLIPENISLQLPFAAVAGDVVLLEPNTGTVSDVFRISNNLVDTGTGTGLGNLVFLYSSDDTSLPPPSTYSANAIFLLEDPSGITSYVGNGTNYLLGAPEPRTLGFLTMAGLILVFRRKHLGLQGDS